MEDDSLAHVKCENAVAPVFSFPFVNLYNFITNRKLREVHKKHLAGDIVVAGILDDLYTTMMEKNLLNIVLPFERIQVCVISFK